MYEFIKAGINLTVYDINPKAVEVLKEAGAKTASSAKEIAENNNVIITMVPNAIIVNSLLSDEMVFSMDYKKILLLLI